MRLLSLIVLHVLVIQSNLHLSVFSLFVPGLWRLITFKHWLWIRSIMINGWRAVHCYSLLLLVFISNIWMARISCIIPMVEISTPFWVMNKWLKLPVDKLLRCFALHRLEIKNTSLVLHLDILVLLNPFIKYFLTHVYGQTNTTIIFRLANYVINRGFFSR